MTKDKMIITAESTEYSLLLAVDKDADLDGEFTAWDIEMNEKLVVNGWLFDITEGEVQ